METEMVIWLLLRLNIGSDYSIFSINLGASHEDNAMEMWALLYEWIFKLKCQVISYEIKELLYQSKTFNSSQWIAFNSKFDEAHRLMDELFCHSLLLFWSFEQSFSTFLEIKVLSETYCWYFKPCWKWIDITYPNWIQALSSSSFSSINSKLYIYVCVSSRCICLGLYYAKRQFGMKHHESYHKKSLVSNMSQLRW